MNILMVCIKFPPFFGGAAVQAIYLAQQLQKNGLTVQFITDNDSGKAVHDEYLGFKVYRHKTFSDKKSLVKDISYLWNVFWYILTHPQFKIVHFHSITGYEAFLFPLIKLLGRKIILKLTLVGHDDPLTLRKRKVGPLILFGFSFVDRFIAISTRLKELSIEAGIPENKVLILYNGTNTEKFNSVGSAEKEQLKKRFGFSQYQKIFLSVGKVEHRKGYDFLLKAWIDISKEIPSAALLIGGPGNEENNLFYKELLSFCHQHQLSNVYFLGKIDNVDEYMKISDCFVFCSRTEGFGTVLIEAMASRVPVVATNIPGVTEDIITDGRIGKICYSQEPKDFARMVIKLTNSIRPVDVEDASQIICRDFSITRIASIYVGLYEDLLKK